MVNYVAIGRRVKKYRNQANLSQADVAEKLGISVSYISQIECGRTDVSLKRLDEIANIINTTVGLLIDEPSVNPHLDDSSIKELTKNWNKDQTNALLEMIQLINTCFNL